VPPLGVRRGHACTLGDFIALEAESVDARHHGENMKVVAPNRMTPRSQTLHVQNQEQKDRAPEAHVITTSPNHTTPHSTSWLSVCLVDHGMM
jgi:hypothetical protein